MLRFTLILPPNDDDQSLELLEEAINDLHVVLMIVISPTREWVDVADELAAKGQGSGLLAPLRRVVWVQQAGPRVLERLVQCLKGKNPPATGVMVLNFHDEVCEVLQPNEIRALTLEKAFLKGYV